MRLLQKVIVCATVLVMLLPMFKVGYPLTHDGVGHFARAANYYLALRQGQLPPRLAPSFMGGYGYPVFNYNYPLLNILAVPLLAVKIPVEVSMKILLGGLYIFGCIGMYSVVKKHAGKHASLFAVSIYASAPFLFNDLYVRGALGEVSAYALFPHVLNAIALLNEKASMKRYIYAFLSILSFMLSHNIFVMILTPVILICTFKIIKKPVFSRKNTELALYLFISGMSSSFFWIPVMFERAYTILGTVNLTNFYAEHFPTLSELIYSRIQQGFSYPGPVDGMSFQLGFPFLIVLLFSIVLLVNKRKQSKPFWGYLCLVMVLLFFILPWSKIIWDHAGVLQFAQFPWRLMGIVMFPLIALSVLVYEKSTVWMKKVLWLSVVVLLFILFHSSIKTYAHFDNDYYFSFSETSTVQHELKPSTLPIEPSDLSNNTPIKEHGTIDSTAFWNGSARKYTIISDVDQYVTEPTAYFPGWQTEIDGVNTKIEYEKSQGYITYFVPKGTHTVETRFTQQTPARLVGNIISILSFIYIGGYIYYKNKKHI